jgi:hypothetical protein
MKNTIQTILTVFREVGPLSYDPMPTLKQAIVHMSLASLAAVVLHWLCGIPWYIAGLAITVLTIGMEYAEYKGWIGKKAWWFDCLFDAYHYQINWIWYSNFWLGLFLFGAFAFGFVQFILYYAQMKKK